jgi:hypothetical protein
MSIASTLLCLTLIVIVAATLLIILLVNGKKEVPATAQKSPKRINTRWKAWLAYIVIALILAIWSVVAALFFLAVVWIMRLNPGPDSSSTVGAAEKKTALRVYIWLLVSSVITVPVFLAVVIASYSENSSTDLHVLSALAPLIFHLPLLAGLTSKSTFVYRHTQQGILLIALRAGLAAIALGIGSNPEDGVLLFLFGNGFLWLFGSIWGWTEVRRGACWWMKQKAESISMGEPTRTEIKPQPIASPEQHLDYSRWYARHDRRDEARQSALEAFRNGNAETRHQAVRLLDELNEIEFF